MNLMGTTSWMDEDEFKNWITDTVRDMSNGKEIGKKREIISRTAVFKPKVKKVIINNPAVIVYWTDYTKTVVKCGKEDTFDAEKGFAIAMCKKLYGNTEFGKELAKINKENE